MTYSLVVKPEAEQDLFEAAKWYEERRAGLGEDFLMAVEVTLETIQRNPKHYLEKYRGIQRALMRRFPYVVYFLVEEETIFVLAVVHDKRDPDYHQSKARET